jgi:hypothetical protein
MTVPQPTLPVQIDDLDVCLRELFTQTAETLARQSKFVQRTSALTGARFAQTLVFGWLARPDASYTQLQQMAALRGCMVSAQAIEQRMNQYAADFLRELLQCAIAEAIQSEPLDLALLRQFNGVFVQDGTIISLPAALREQYAGCGGSTAESGQSAIRVQVRLDLLTGALQGPWLQSARECERSGSGTIRQTPLPAQALFLADSAYFPLKDMRHLSEQQVWWLTHARADLSFRDAHGIKYTLIEYLTHHAKEAIVDTWITLGNTHATRQRVRLIAFRVSEQTAQQRRAHADHRSKARGKGSRRDVRVGKKRERPSIDGHHRAHPSQKRLQLSEWTILLCNSEEECLTPAQARALMRARWQIELVWRLWKERGQVDIWRSEKAPRILCELYAKLLGMLLQHWLTIVGCWHAPDRSLVKASLAVQLLAPSCALTLDGPVDFCAVLRASQRMMRRARLNATNTRPSTARLLQEPELTIH